MSGKFVLYFIVLQSILWPVAKASARPEISISNIVEVSQRQKLRLGDIAIIKGGDVQLVKQINKLVLREDARGILLSQHIESAEVLKKLKNEMDQNATFRKVNPSFKVPSIINVNFSKSLISSEEIERKILNFLSARCSDCEYNLTLQPIPQLNTREWELDFDQMTAKGGLLLPMRDPSSQTLKWISGQIRISKLTPVVTRMISQGERLSAGDLQLNMTDVTFAKDNVLRVEDIDGQLAARTLSVGTVVWSSDIRKEPATKKGQMVKGLMGNENFEISVNMEAQENGFIRDIVKVKNLENNKYFSGQVVEKGVVKLQ